jgi:magnesium transporter
MHLRTGTTISRAQYREARVLEFHSFATAGKIDVDISGTLIPPEVSWIDAFRPEKREIDFLERTLGIEVPSFADLSEIESSSRLYKNTDHLILSVPAHYRTVGDVPRTTPLGFVLSKDHLLTIRFKPLKPCDHLHDSLAKQPIELQGGLGAFIAVVEGIVEHTADELEAIAAELDTISDDIFAGDSPPGKGERPRPAGDHLRLVLRRIVRIGDHAAKISDILLGMARMIPFVTSNPIEPFGSEYKTRLKSLQRDVGSLSSYERRLTEQVQFLLDATLGLTNIDQNDIFRILTAVSVVGIPPTFLTSLYGMNFKFMPELDWTYGYVFALALIALSAILPIFWFKKRGWW